MKTTQEYPRPGYKGCSSAGGKEKGNIVLGITLFIATMIVENTSQRGKDEEKYGRGIVGPKSWLTYLEENTLTNCLQAGETEVTGVTYVSQKVGELRTLMFKGRR